LLTSGGPKGNSGRKGNGEMGRLGNCIVQDWTSRNLERKKGGSVGLAVFRGGHLCKRNGVPTPASSGGLRQPGSKLGQRGEPEMGRARELPSDKTKTTPDPGCKAAENGTPVRGEYKAAPAPKTPRAPEKAWKRPKSSPPAKAETPVLPGRCHDLQQKQKKCAGNDARRSFERSAGEQSHNNNEKQRSGRRKTRVEGKKVLYRGLGTSGGTRKI